MTGPLTAEDMTEIIEVLDARRRAYERLIQITTVAVVVVPSVAVSVVFGIVMGWW